MEAAKRCDRSRRSRSGRGWQWWDGSMRLRQCGCVSTAGRNNGGRIPRQAGERVLAAVGQGGGALSFWQTTAGPAVVWLWVRQVAERTGGSQLRSRLAGGDVGGVSSSSTPHAAESQAARSSLRADSAQRHQGPVMLGRLLPHHRSSAPKAARSPCRARQTTRLRNGEGGAVRVLIMARI